MRLALATLVVLALASAFFKLSSGLSHFGVPPDPNNPALAGIQTPEVLLRGLSGASDNLLARIYTREVRTPEQMKKADAVFKVELAKAANTLLKNVDIGSIPPSKAWEYGKVFIAARWWREAKAALETAVSVAKNEDRRVNDNLQLARVMAELGDVRGAVARAGLVVNEGTKDTDTAPILPGTLLELVPAAEGKGADAELARLLEEAIKCENRTIVDAGTEPGAAFLLARPTHIRNAWGKVIELFRSAGRLEEARAAEEKSVASKREQASA